MDSSGAIHETLAHHDKQLLALDSRLGGVEKIVSSVDYKLDRLVQNQASAAANRPSQMLDAIRTGLSILSTLAFLTGATVAAIVYVSSNANNADLTLLKWRTGKLETERMSWPAEVRAEPR